MPHSADSIPVAYIQKVLIPPAHKDTKTHEPLYLSLATFFDLSLSDPEKQAASGGGVLPMQADASRHAFCEEGSLLPGDYRLSTDNVAPHIRTRDCVDFSALLLLPTNLFTKPSKSSLPVSNTVPQSDASRRRDDVRM